ncbi:ATP--guanido phosphotransferase [Candidatus Zixiibacteriota bacterium]
MSSGIQTTLQEMSVAAPSWFTSDRSDGKDVVLTTRLRLARNLHGQVFPHQAQEEVQEALLRTVWDACDSVEPFTGSQKISMADLTWEDRRFLMERFLVDSAMTGAEGSRGVALNRAEDLTVLVNEEDHVRLQSVASGLSPDEAWTALDRVDDTLGETLAWAYRDGTGYLTASPTNVGTGLRMSLLIHLPALVLTSDVEHVLRKVAAYGMRIRGVHGDGSAVFGNLFRLSNDPTLGRSEEDIMRSVAGTAHQLEKYELDARETLWQEARAQLEDKIHRALGILQSARVLSQRECMNLLSAVRLGVNMDVLSGVELHRLDTLTILTQPSHLDRRAGRVLEPGERDVLRAEAVRDSLASGRN